MDVPTLLATLAVLISAATLVIIIAMTRRAPTDASALQAPFEALRLEVRTSLDGAIQTLGQRIAQLSAEVDRRLSAVGGDVGRQLESTSQLIGQRLDTAAGAVAKVHEKLGTVQGVTERVLEVGKDIASLQQILRAPKLRGGLGELFLGEVLSQTLPPSAYTMQHGFSSGQRVDAVVKVGDRLVPIDAKFPLENFNRLAAAIEDSDRSAARRAFFADVRRRIDEIAERYIRPEEDTYDFALMYIPAENVYYETVVRDEQGSASIYEYALERRVVPVSPQTLYAYLQVILLGLKGLRIEDRAQEILHAALGLAGDLDRFRGEFAILGKHLEDAAKKFSESSRRLDRLREALGRLHGIDDGRGNAAADPTAGARAP